MEKSQFSLLNKMKPTTFLILLSVAQHFLFCTNRVDATKPGDAVVHGNASTVRPSNKKNIRTVHVFVALCDNKYQGIVPVGKLIGNGQDPENNLYWGCENGLRTYFKQKNSDWTLIKKEKNISEIILERLLFKHKTQEVYVLADAYDGKYIKQTTLDFLNATAGRSPLTYMLKNDSLYFGGASDLTSYIGHDGLMDFSIPIMETSVDSSKRDAIVLACYSKKYFSPHVKASGARPLVWTTGLMAPEAYTLHDALGAWVQKKDGQEIRAAASKAYSKFQKCSIKAARNLLVSGW
jgi:hypothetical protein